MILVDTALKERAAAGKPIRIGLVGPGFMGRTITIQVTKHVPGMEVVAIFGRSPEAAARAFAEAGLDGAASTGSGRSIAQIWNEGRRAICKDPFEICHSTCIDVVVEATGTVEFGAHVVLRAIENGKHVVMVNAELDGTIGPVLATKARAAGRVLTNIDGDQPGAIMNLYRFVRGMGLDPILCGNIKGLQDHYRTPETQAGFAKRWGQSPHMVTSFADGTKISFEQAVVANATGMRVARRGMLGPTVPPGTQLSEAIKAYPLDEILREPGIVDYVVGAEPGPGVFVLAALGDPAQDQPRRQHLELYKMGPGPVYCFYTPYHLCFFEVPFTVARAVLFKDAAVAAVAPMVDVVATAKRDLDEGDTIDRIGGYMTYGQAENSEVAVGDRLLPIGLAEGCQLKRRILKDQVLTWDDVKVPLGRLADRLRAEQDQHFFPACARRAEPA